MIKYYIRMGIIYFILTSYILVTNEINEPLYALKNILIPYDYETNKIIFINLIINYSFIIICIMNIIKNFSSLFEIKVFIVQRTTRKKAYLIFLKYIIKSMMILLIIKFFIDICLNRITSIIDLEILLKLYLLQFLTIFLWMFTIFILYLYDISEKKISFLMITFVFICQYLSFRLPMLNVVVIGSKDTLANLGIVVTMKVIILSVVVFLSYLKFKKYELIGGIRND